MAWSYPIIVLAAIVTGVWLSRGRQQSLGLTRQQRIAIGLGAFCGAMIGAKLPYLLADWPGLISGRAWFDNGKTILCGLVGGYFGVEITKWALEIRVKTGDSFAVPVAAAVAVGRLSCFVGGCCYGTHTKLPWGVDFCDDGPRHPTQLYEAAWHGMSAIILAELQRRGLFRGQLIKLYILGYLVFRFVTEFIRPEPKVWLGLTAYQWGALGLMPVFVGLWIKDARRFAREREAAKPQA